MQAIFFGSIGTMVETSEIQRKAFNTAFKEFGLNWYWNTGNYINMIQKPGGISRIKEYSKLKLKDNEVKKIYDLKIKYFRKYCNNLVKPREGVLDIINYANKNDIKLSILRISSAYGFDNRFSEQGVINKWLYDVLKHGEIKLLNSKDSKINFPCL